VVFTERIGPLIVPRAGHFLQWERADLLNQCLTYFFRDLLR
jgi:pimeloyl-ACP methyl ester carboxylesterase